jgi:hypothetical protein
MHPPVLLSGQENTYFTLAPHFCMMHPHLLTVLVGQIIELAELRDIPHEEMGDPFWQHHELLENPDPREMYALVRHMDYKNEPLPKHAQYPLLPPSLQDLVLSSSMQWIQAERIKAIAFVFQVDHVNLGAFSCGGMQNVSL